MELVKTFVNAICLEVTTRDFRGALNLKATCFVYACVGVMIFVMISVFCVPPPPPSHDMSVHLPTHCLSSCLSSHRLSTFHRPLTLWAWHTYMATVSLPWACPGDRDYGCDCDCACYCDCDRDCWCTLTPGITWARGRALETRHTSANLWSLVPRTHGHLLVCECSPKRIYYWVAIVLLSSYVDAARLQTCATRDMQGEFPSPTIVINNTLINTVFVL